MSQGGDRQCKLHSGGRENPSSKKSQRLKWKHFPLVVLLCWGAGLGIHSSTGLACDSDQNANISTPLKLHLLSHETKQEGVDLHQLKITYSMSIPFCHPKNGKKKSIKDGHVLVLKKHVSLSFYCLFGDCSMIFSSFSRYGSLTRPEL